MIATRRSFLFGTTALCLTAAASPLAAKTLADPVLEIATLMPAPEWALLERELIESQTEACEAFFERYFDERGYLTAIERWGGNDGPDDAIENVNNWPQLYSLGGSERIRQMYEKAYEGHVRQYTEAKTTEVPFARNGMYFKEFPVMMDWQHNAEGLTVFNVMGLGNPYNKKYRDRVRRFAGFYTGEDPAAPNYDPKHKIIRAMFNGSRGPLMRKATGLDWAGDPIDVTGIAPEALLHGERSYEEFVAHFKDYNDTVGDNPLNLISTTLAFNAYALAHEKKYRDWILEYTDAWAERAKANNDIIPTNVGLDGKLGGETEGKWYGGVYGWSFSPVVPMTGVREDRNRIPYSFLGFLSAFLITGDDKYLDVWRRMTDRINSNAKMVDGKMSSPTMYGDNGWYSFKPGRWQVASQDIYMLTMKASDRARAPDHPYLLYLEGKNPGYPGQAMRGAMNKIREKAEALRADTTTPDTRLVDTMMDQNPAIVSELIQLMEGGAHIGRPGWSRISPGVGGALHITRLRYFDPDTRRPGVPKDVAALVESMTADTTTVSLVNIGSTHSRTVTIQGGAYGEHQILSISDGATTRTVGDRTCTVRLAPGAGTKLTLKMKRYANQPTLDFPWGAPAVDEQLRDKGKRESANGNPY
ncbi:hypothetical protein [Sphingomonas sp.]|jgi:hypothetical protein|uniref:hypothetical protein n=1 Tax=Sphingomonas sp. TaxID=28214 RepID=UPI002ED7FE63